MKPVGYVEVPAAQVADVARRGLAHIHRLRGERAEKIIQETLARLNRPRWWHRSGRPTAVTREEVIAQLERGCWDSRYQRTKRFWWGDKETFKQMMALAGASVSPREGMVLLNSEAAELHCRVLSGCYEGISA